ncbi:ATP-binding protein [Streptomyces malaysiensis]|uniref:ATP-binding protein n=1 Tax=Streptomyces malaysiensis TaxID=92644 RepID=UPI0033F5FE46
MDELDQLNAVMVADRGGSLVVSVYVITGTAGAGKTSLALRWAHQVRERFPDGQLYVNLRGYDPREPITAQQVLHGFLTALGVRPDAIPHNLDDAAGLYRSLLAERRMLVVLDNAATVSQVRPLLPGSTGSLAVVTSRSRLSGLAIRDGARRITLGTLPEAEAVALLRAVTAGYRSEDDAEKLTELAHLCACLPLALRIAAERAATHPYLRLDDLITDLRDDSALWDVLSTGDEDEAEAVRTVFTWSYRALAPSAARLFRLLGIHPGPEFSLHAASALAGLPTGRVRQALDTLVGAHLLEQTAPDRYEFHDLLRAYATKQAQEEEPAEDRTAALCRVLDWYVHTADAVQSWIEPEEDHLSLAPPAAGVLPLSFPEYDHAVDWSEREHANLLAAVRAAGAASLDRHAWQLSTVLFSARAPSISVNDWLAVAPIGLEAVRRLGEPLGEAWLLECLGMSYTRGNDLIKSRECHESALAIRREVGDRHGEAQCLNLLGLVHLRLRELANAETCFQRARSAFGELGFPHWESIALINLADVCYQAGRVDEAAHNAELVYAGYRARNDRPNMGRALRLLSSIHLDHGEFDAALRTASEAVNIALDLRHHVLEGYWLIALGNAQRALGEFSDSLISFQRSASLHRRLGDRSREAMAWHGTGETYRAMSRLDEAAKFHRRAAAAHHALGDHWHEALALGGLAFALAEGDGDQSRQHRAEALRLLTRYYDPRAEGLRAQIEQR